MKQIKPLQKFVIKNLFLFLMIFFVPSCVGTQSGLTTYQVKNVNKFSQKKNYRPNKGKNGPRYVAPRKRGEINHPAVTKETRKIKKSEIRRQRSTGN